MSIVYYNNTLRATVKLNQSIGTCFKHWREEECHQQLPFFTQILELSFQSVLSCCFLNKLTMDTSKVAELLNKEWQTTRSVSEPHPCHRTGGLWWAVCSQLRDVQKAVRGELRSKMYLELGGRIKRCGFWLRTCTFKAAAFITEGRIKTALS